MRALVWLHRWIGVCVCLLFAMWFLSGAVMLFVPFPSLSSGERLRLAPQLDLSAVVTPPAEVLQKVPDATSLRLISRDGAPTYLAMSASAGLVAIDAATGVRARLLTADAAVRAASRFSDAPVDRVDAGVWHDQWTVHQAFDAARPYFRIHLADGARTALYVSAASGEVVQRTTRSQRVWNQVGSVIHWIYFTPVRKHWSLWDRLVWWSSLMALVGAVAGMLLGIVRTVQAQRSGGAVTLLRGWWRWHHLVGLAVGLFLVAWIFSGWLSMDHGRMFSTSGATDVQQLRLRGRSIQQTAAEVSLESLRTIGSAAEVRFSALGGRNFLLARGGGLATRLYWSGDAEPHDRIADAQLVTAAAHAWPEDRPSLSPPAEPHDIHLAAEELSGEVREILLPQSARRVYLNSVTGEVEAVMDASRRAYSWAFYALHTWRVPALAAREPLRIGMMLLMLAGGFVLSVTGVVLSVRRLKTTGLKR